MSPPLAIAAVAFAAAATAVAASTTAAPSAASRSPDASYLYMAFNPAPFAIQIVITSLGAAASAAILAAMARFGRFPETLLSASVLVVDLVLSLFLFGVSVASLAIQAPALGVPGMCHVMTLLYDGSQYAATLTFMVVAVLNWMIVVKHCAAVSTRTALSCVAAVWTFILVVMVATFATSSLFSATNGLGTAAPAAAAAPSGAPSEAPSDSTTRFDWRRTAASNPQLVLSVVLLCIMPIVVIWAYTSINMRVRAIERSVREVIGNSVVEGACTLEDLGRDTDLPGKPIVVAATSEATDSSGNVLSNSPTAAADPSSPLALWTPYRRRGSSSRRHGIGGASNHSRFDTALRNIARRSFVTTVVFIFFWGIMIATKLIAFLGTANIPLSVLAAGHFMYLLTTIANPLVFLMYDQRLQTGIAQKLSPAYNTCQEFVCRMVGSAAVDTSPERARDPEHGRGP
ncbi:hypothetical protein HK105_201657 [Polyrhizophydium stewartii]|uniref:G-protein coupled receptors family 1 profile domain-containing protein n=1 Tax=Polyrhizophydium stewartii TaxID=2732419 RepID=A0ABR4NH07_9FUNG